MFVSALNVITLQRTTRSRMSSSISQDCPETRQSIAQGAKSTISNLTHRSDCHLGAWNWAALDSAVKRTISD
jgi:hypothetical protein